MFFVYLGWAHLLCLLTREDLRTNERLILINGIKPSLSKSSDKILDQNKISQIKKCINNFSSISREDIGYSKDVSGSAFLPIPNHRQLLICRSKFSLEENNQLLEVVKIGPDALPYLIDALTSTIVTNITVNNIDTKFEFDCNEAILEELLFKNKHSIKMDQESSGKSLPQYKLKVGDISFVAVGQIIGRKYEAMHYQMTDSIIVNGPLINPEIAKYIKLSFAGRSVRERFFEKLLLDYSTVSTSKIIDPFTLSRISSIRVEAALRLLYYYPNETLELFLHDLDNLDVKNVESTDSRKQRHDQMSREIKNGYLKTDEYVKALASIKHPKIKSAIIAIAKKTDDTDILIGTLEAFSDQDLDILRDIASKHAASITSNERISPYTEVKFLILVANKLGQKSDRILRSYLKSNNPKKYELFAIAFQNFNGDWLNEFYLRMLNIKSGTKIKSPIPVYWPVNKDLRICDIAAYSLKLKNAELKFDLSAPLSDRNVQITDIIKQLSK